MTDTRITPFRGMVLLAVSAAVLILLLAKGADAGNEMLETEGYTVVSGDTLWGVAETVAGPDVDVRELVYDIKRLNKLDTALIHPGQVLVVPAG